MTPTESIIFGFDFTKLLPGSETLSSVTHVQCIDAEQTITGGATVATTDLTIGSPGINTSATFDNDEGGTVATSEGVQVRISTGIDGGDYTLRCRVVTSLSNTRELLGILQVRNS
jgi:hypothetical protein